MVVERHRQSINDNPRSGVSAKVPKWGLYLQGRLMPQLSHLEHDFDQSRPFPVMAEAIAESKASTVSTRSAHTHTNRDIDPFDFGVG